MRHKRGDIDHAKGLVFWQYRGHKEVWLKPEEFTAKHKRQKAYGRQYHKENRDRILPQMRERARRYKQWLTPQHQEWRKRNKHKLRNKRFEREYGMAEGQYDAMMAEQRGVCAICGQPPPEDRLLCVDHCHASGSVRKLLCVHCNAGLGQFFDKPDILRKAAEYLETHQPTAPMQE